MLKIMRNCIFLILILAKLIFAQCPPRVTTSLGIVAGTCQKTYRDKSFYQFEGVPYAAPPVDDLRYEEPQDAKKWKGILNATTVTSCIQFNQWMRDKNGNAVLGTEDCLYYNVYTPTLNRSANLNVIIFIHGGAFMFGNGGQWRPNIILERPIVYVSINYRLGPLGFLSTEDDVIPGNLGLGDQQKAIKTIKKNIQYFGGNPNSITLFGMSAGSASVQFHCLLPESRGLFHKGILESGTVLNNWVLMEAPLEKAKHLASLVGCPTSPSDLKSCMKTISARQIVQNVKEFQPFLYNPFSPWAVVIDGYWASKPIVPDHPLNLLRKKKIYDVPLLMSFTTSEGLYPAADFYAKDEYLEDINTNWNKLMPDIMMYNYTIDHRIIDCVSQKIRHGYLGKAPLNRRSFHDLVQAVGDRCFVADIEKGLRLHSAGISSLVWGYMYNYRANISVSEFGSNTTENLGVSHGDDTLLIVGQRSPTTSDDIAMSDLLMDMIMSFIVTGSPNISSQWEPVSKNVHQQLKLLKINRYDDLQPLHEKYIGNRPFWDSLPFKENERLLNINLGF